MPISAKFAADFSSFNEAVEKAAVKLTSFEANANKVSTSLSRMTNSFTGTKLIQDATLMAKAVENAGGVAVLTEKELARLGAQANEAAEKMQKLGIGVPENLKAIQLAAQEAAEAEKKAAAAAQAVTDAANKTVGSKLTGWFSDLGKQALSTAAGFVTAQAVIGGVTSGIRALTDFVGDSVSAYAAAEAAQVKLTTAMKAQGTAIPANITKLNDLATEFQRTTIYSDDLISGMEALLIQIGDVMPDKMDEALKASTNLAAGLGIDLESATRLVAKAAAGHTETLGKYGITVDKAALQTQGFDAVLQAVNRQFGGQAAAAAETYAGSIAQIANSWDNVKEAVGKAIVTDPIVAAGMRAIAAAAADADKSASGFSGTLVDIASKIQVIPFGSLLKAYSDLLTAQKLLAAQKDIVLPPEPIKASGDAFSHLADQAGHANDELAALSDTQTQQLAAALKSGAVDMQEVAKATGLSVEALKLFKASMDGSAEALKKASEAQRVWAGVMRDVGTQAQGFGRTVDTIDGKVVEGIRYYREQGVELSKLATFYGLTEQQARALDQQFKFEESVVDATQKAFHGLTITIPTVTSRQKELDNVTQGLTEDGLLPANDAIGQTTERLMKLKNVAGGAGEGLKQFSTDAQSLGASLSKDLTRIPDIVVGSLTGGGGLKGAAEGVGSLLGSTIGESVGKTVSTLGKLGGPIGAAIGSLAGPAISALVGLFNSAEKQINPARQAFINAAGGLEQLNKKAFEATGSLGSVQALLNARNPKAYESAIKDLNAALDLHKRALDALPGIMSSVSSGLNAISAGTIGGFNRVNATLQNSGEQWVGLSDKAAKLVAQIGELESLDALTPKQQAQLIAWQRSLSDVHTEMTKLSSAQVAAADSFDTIGSEGQAAFDRIGRLASSAFNAAVAGGQGFLKSLESIAPTMRDLIEAQKTFGFTSSETLGTLLQFSAFADANKELVASIDGVNQMMTGLHEMGLLTQQDFTDLDAVATDTFNQMVAQGLSGDQAIRALQPTLQKVWELQQDFGFSVDDATQSLLDQANQAGVVGEKMRSVQQQTLDVLRAIAKVLGADIPNAAQSGADAVSNSLASIKVPNLKVPVDFDLSGFPKLGGEAPEWSGEAPEGAFTGGIVGAQAIQHFARGGHVLPFIPHGTDTVPAMLTPGEVVLNASQQKAVGALMNRGGGASGGSGGDVHVHLEGAFIGAGATREIEAIVSRAVNTRKKQRAA